MGFDSEDEISDTETDVERATAVRSIKNCILISINLKFSACSCVGQPRPPSYI